MIDLHTHTIFSDGALTVEELVDNAISNGVKVLSITDHDTVLGLSHYSDDFSDITIIPGIEFSTDTYYFGRKTKIHLLGYGYSIDDKSIEKCLSELYSRRSNDNKTYIEDLINKYSFLSKEFFVDFDYGKYGWLYKYILNHVSKNLKPEQFEQLKNYLVNNKPHYSKYNENVEDMIKLMHSSNGYAVFAHPQKCDVTSKELDKLINYLKDIGLDGIETYHAEANKNDREIIHKLALKYNLYETGGSDFHSFIYASGVGNPKINYPDDYEPLLVKRLIKENKYLGAKNE